MSDNAQLPRETPEVGSATQVADLPAGTPTVVTYFADEDLPAEAKQNLTGAGVSGLEDARSRGETNGRLLRHALFRGDHPILMVGLGRRQDFSATRWRRVVESAAGFLTRRGYNRLAILLPAGLDGITGAAGIEGAIRGAYDEGLLKTRERTGVRLDGVTLVSRVPLDSESTLRAQIVGESANAARDLVNLPPNALNPSTFADRLSEFAEESGLGIEVLDERGIADLGMGAVAGVASGSSQPPRVIDLQYGQAQSAVRLALVGKGLTFDSGGLSLKTHEGMEWMKADMGGAAAVAGAMRALGRLKPAGVFVRGLIGAVENLPGPSAMKPGDVLKTLNGKTIEVLNTDAEGRLVLSDLLAYAVDLGATHIVDLATLTGAAVVALGHEAAAIIGKPQAWIDQVRAAAENAGERTWQLPLYPEYRRRMDSDLADMKNTGGRPGGAITAAAMLSEFVGDVPWAHLDIAGTAWTENSTEYAPSGGTGYGVATLVSLAYDLSQR